MKVASSISLSLWNFVLNLTTYLIDNDFRPKRCILTVADIELGDEKKIGFSLELLSICIARNEMVSYVGYGFEVLTVLDVITVLQLPYNI